MRIRRFIYLIFSFIALIFLAALSITYDNTFFFILMMIVILVPNNMIKNAERRITNDILARYGFECDPYQYINELEAYAKKCLLTKRQKAIYNLYYALAYIDAGDFEEVKYLLLEIDQISDKLDEVTRVLYLKAWCDYFFYNNLEEKMKFTLLKMRDIITNSTNNGFKANYSIIYMLLEAKYYIVSGVNLDKAKELFKNRKALINTKLSIITSNYQLALLDIKEKNFGAAKEKLMLVSKHNECLHVVRSAQLILDKIDNYIIKN